MIQASAISTYPGELNYKQINSQRYAHRDSKEVIAKTPVFSTFFGSETAGMHTAVIHKRLKAAEPTIVNGPMGLAGSPRVPIVSNTLSKISGADDPRAIKVRFATVSFHLGTSTNYVF